MKNTLPRLALLAPLLALTGCPERPLNRGTDVPEHAGERFPDSGSTPAAKAPHDAAPETKTDPKDSSTDAAQKK